MNKRVKRIGVWGLFRVVFDLVGLAAISVVGWVAYQSVTPEAENQQAAETAVNLSTPVRLVALQMQDEILVERRFLGRLEARQSADIAFEFGGTISAIAVQEGDRVMKGDVLATLATDALVVERGALEANLAAVQSQFEFAQAELERIGQLVNSGAAQASRLGQIASDRDTLASRLVEVESAIEQVVLRIRKSRLSAPFDGIIGAKGTNRGETVAAGQHVVSIFDDSGIDFRVGLPTTLGPEELRNPRISVNGKDYPVALSAVRPDIDFRTNTRVAIFQVETAHPLSFGLSATLSADVMIPVTGAWVSVDAMRPSAEGYWIVLAVDDNMVAEAVAVEVEHMQNDRAFVIGAFATGTRIINAGAHKVVPGQKVRAQ